MGGVTMTTVEHADYREFMGRLDDASVDLIVTDPPYGINYQNNYTHTPHARLEGDDIGFSYKALADEAFRVLKPNTAIFAFTGWSEYPRHYPELEGAGFQMREPVICQKRPSGTADLYGTFQTNADWVMFGHKGRFVFQPTELVRNKRAGTVPNIGRKPVPEFKTRFPSCWFGENFPWASENPASMKARGIVHPTIKGQQFIEWPIRLACPVGGLVLDPFVGSGTTALAAAATGRRFVGCEIDGAHVATAHRRLRLRQSDPSSSEQPIEAAPDPIGPQ
jgi:site-specific DNA-methyltransferase (adenine-specific)